MRITRTTERKLEAMERVSKDRTSVVNEAIDEKFAREFPDGFPKKRRTKREISGKRTG